MQSRRLAKLTRPRLYDAVPRERLFRLLDDGCARPMLWIAGPPGAGKTTLIASWLRSRGLQEIWYQVDPGDGDPATFFHYLQTAAPERKHALPRFAPEHFADLPGFSRRFFRELFARLPDPGALVLDNYQEAPADSPFHRLVEQAAEEIPHGVNVICVSRTEPPPALARVVASNQLALIGWPELKLTFEETRQIVEGLQSMDAATLETLHRRADGWAAGVTLMAERVRRNGMLPEAFDPETREAVFNYFATVIFERLPPEDERVLLTAAIPPSVTAGIAAQLSTAAEAGRLLEQLYRQHLFTYRRAAIPHVYEFHPLFREFLLTRACARLAPEELAGLTSHAAALLEQNGQTDDALLTYIEAQDWASAARMLRQHADHLVAQGRGQTLRNWIGHLPQDLRSQDPWFDYWAGKSQIWTDPYAAYTRLESAFLAFKRMRDGRGEFLAVAGILEALQWQWNLYAEYDDWVPTMEQLLRAQPEGVGTPDRVRGLSSLIHGLTHRQPHHPRLFQYVEDLMDLLSEPLDANLKLNAGAEIAQHLHFLPDMNLLARLERLVQPSWEDRGASMASRILWYGKYAHCLQRLGDFQRVLQMLDECTVWATREGLPRRLRFLGLARQLTLVASGRWKEAEQNLGRLAAMVDPAADQGPYHALLLAQAGMALQQGDNIAAARLARLAVSVADQTGFMYIRVRSRPLLVAALAECGEFAEADAMLAEGRQLAARLPFWYVRVELELMEAYVRLAQGATATGLELLRKTLEGVRHLPPTHDFLDVMCLRVRARLYAQALQAQIEPDLVRSIIRRYHITPDDQADESWPWPVKVYSLGRFEVLLDDQPLAWGRKTPRKTLSLLKALVAFGGKDVPESKLVDALWPEEDGDSAHRRYAVTLLRLRRLLGDPTLLWQDASRLSVDRTRCWVDVYALEDAIARQRDGTGHLSDRLLRLYRGAFLDCDPDAEWAVGERQRVRSRFLRAVRVEGRWLEEKSEWHAAAELYARALEADASLDTLRDDIARCDRARYAGTRHQGAESAAANE